ncbi:MAG: phage integrase family protein [Deltaproteobacteria bacterium]|nr:phage integrase family protein [Deltaproteobacteria bacterium]
MGKTEKGPKKARIKIRGGMGPDKYLSKAQQQKFWSYVKAQADLGRARGSKRAVADELICHLLIHAGLRADEVCSLRLKDLPVSHGKNSIWVYNSKGNVSRAVEIPPKLVQTIKRFCRLCRKGADPEDPLFISSTGKPMCYMTLYQKIRRIGKKSGVGKLHPHMLRHTYATRLYAVEKDLFFVSDQLGHSNVSTTHIYAKTDSESRRNQVEKIMDE